MPHVKDNEYKNYEMRGFIHDRAMASSQKENQKGYIKYNGKIYEDINKVEESAKYKEIPCPKCDKTLLHVTETNKKTFGFRDGIKDKMCDCDITQYCQEHNYHEIYKNK